MRRRIMIKILIKRTGRRYLCSEVTVTKVP